MKKITVKNDYVRVEGKTEWAESWFTDEPIYMNYGSMPYKEGDSGTSERIGHFIDRDKEKYPQTMEELKKFLINFVV